MIFLQSPVASPVTFSTRNGSSRCSNVARNVLLEEMWAGRRFLRGHEGDEIVSIIYRYMNGTEGNGSIQLALDGSSRSGITLQQALYEMISP